MNTHRPYTILTVYYPNHNPNPTLSASGEASRMIRRTYDLMFSASTLIHLVSAAADLVKKTSSLRSFTSTKTLRKTPSMFLESDSDCPSDPGDIDNALTGFDRIRALIKQSIQMVRVYQHKAKKWMVKLNQAQIDFDENKAEADKLEFVFTIRNGCPREWQLYDDLTEDKIKSLSSIQTARVVIDETLDQIQQTMQEAWQYMYLLENAGEVSCMDLDDL